MAIVEVRQIVKKFGDVTAVDGVDLASRDGEFLVLLGPSGCGKTTLLRMIAGLEIPSAGHVFIEGRDVSQLPPRQRNVAMVFQSYALYPHMTVFKNIAFPLKPLKMQREDIREKVMWSASMFGIGHLLARRPRELSGGERQRVALARAMVREPSVFLLDEPLSNLDAKLRTSAREELEQLQKRIGITTLYVTHDQVEAMGLGDRIVVMNEGRVRQVGTPHEVYHRSADTFVATFLGSPPMNLLEKDGLVIGFRPENFLPVQLYGDDRDVERFRFDVTWMEDLGSDRLIYGNVEREFAHRHVVAKLSANVTFSVEPKESYTFAVPKDKLNFFDAGTGLRLEGRFALRDVHGA
ncbi:MAG: ABC transporter ATP-binding protein [bacterium]|nr:MAG: ABC transporter ATP-binding protein [bacterium]